MSDIFKIQEAITFIQSSPPETFRLMDTTIQVTPVSYEHGKITATAAVVDLLIAEEVNIFTLYCTTGVSLKVGSSVASAMTNVTHFSYQGAKTKFYISNPGTEDISVNFAASSV